MRFLRSIKQAANKYVTQVEDLLWSHDDEEKEENSEISLSDDVWVICPFNDCSILMSFDGLEIVTKAECPSCHRLFCVQCKVPWHEGLNCQQFQRKLACSNKTYMIVDSQNSTVPKKRSSPFEGRDNDEKKKAKKKDAIPVDSNQASYQNLVKVNCNEFQQQKSKEKATVESGCKCSSQSPKSKSICDLCYDIVPDANIVRGSTICNHQFCANCISKHVAEQLSQNIKKICCPNPVCSVELKPQYLQHILPKEVVGRWEYESYMAWWNRDFK